jgi:hypothetical protein
MVKDVVEDQQQQPRRDHCETTIQRVHETETMLSREASGAQKKQ